VGAAPRRVARDLVARGRRPPGRAPQRRGRDRSLAARSLSPPALAHDVRRRRDRALPGQRRAGVRPGEPRHARAETQPPPDRAAHARADGVPSRALRDRVAETTVLADRLDKERMGWTAPFAAILRAAIANAKGDRSGAIVSLKEAIDLAKTAQMAGYETAARHQLGLLVGGDEGARMVASAEDAMKAEGIRVPARFAATLVPGRWGS